MRACDRRMYYIMVVIPLSLILKTLIDDIEDWAHLSVCACDRRMYYIMVVIPLSLILKTLINHIEDWAHVSGMRLW